MTHQPRCNECNRKLSKPENLSYQKNGRCRNCNFEKLRDNDSNIYWKHLFDVSDDEDECQKACYNRVLQKVVWELLLPDDWLYNNLKYVYRGGLSVPIGKVRFWVQEFGKRHDYDPESSHGILKNDVILVSDSDDSDGGGFYFHRSKIHRDRKFMWALKNEYAKFGIRVWVSNHSTKPLSWIKFSLF